MAQFCRLAIREKIVNLSLPIYFMQRTSFSETAQRFFVGKLCFIFLFAYEFLYVTRRVL